MEWKSTKWVTEKEEKYFKSAHYILWHVDWMWNLSSSHLPFKLFTRELFLAHKMKMFECLFIFHFFFFFQLQCHSSPIYALARNPSFLKNFLTVGDWNARIWSEDCKESSIIWTKYCNVELTDGCWSPTKCSLFYLSRMDGNVEAWDLLQQQSEPVLTIKVIYLENISKFFIHAPMSFFGWKLADFLVAKYFWHKI